MSRKSISSQSVSIYLDPGDMESAGLGSYPDDCALKRFVRKELEAHGETVWPRMELDVFSGAGGALLLIARPLPDSPICFRFKSCEDLITAVCLCGQNVPSELACVNDEYYLLLYCGGQPPLVLFEYGDITSFSESSIAHLREHGDFLIHSGAVDLLRKYFFK